jgi:hypothetical protein
MPGLAFRPFRWFPRVQREALAGLFNFFTVVHLLIFENYMIPVVVVVLATGR